MPTVLRFLCPCQRTVDLLTMFSLLTGELLIAQDLDDDNDGIPDVTEVRLADTDSNGWNFSFAILGIVSLS